MAFQMPKHLKKFIFGSLTGHFLLLIVLAIIQLYDGLLFIRIIQPHEWVNYRYPHKPDHISELELFIIMTVLLIFCFGHIAYEKFISKKFLLKNWSELYKSVFASYALACIVNLILTIFIKKTYGRPRPDFLNRCFPNIALSDHDAIKELIYTGTDHKHLNVTFECFFDTQYKKNGYKSHTDPNFLEFMKGYPTNPKGGVCDLKCIKKGRRSFPSGHSSNAWVSFLWFSLFLWGKMKAFAPAFKKQSIRLVPGFLVMIFPIYTAISRTQDYRHHWEDVFVGSIIGISCAIFGYRHYFPSLSDNDCNLSYSQIRWMIKEGEASGDEKVKLMRQRLHTKFGTSVIVKTEKVEIA